MSTNETPVTTENTEKEGITALPETKAVDTTVTPETPEVPLMAQPAQVSQRQICQNVHALCNTTLYVLTKGFYPGADADKVDAAKQFVIEIKKDVESRLKAMPADEKPKASK